MVRPREIKFIEDWRKRWLTYRKRKATLNKAAFELSTLCNVSIAVLCFDPDGRPDTWPYNDDGKVREFVARHRNLSTQERCKRVIDQLSHLADRVSEDEDQNLKGCPWLDNLPEESLRALANSIESSLHPVKKRIQLLKDAECDRSNRCSTSEQGQGGLHHSSVEYLDAPIESTAGLEQSGGFIEDLVMAFDPYPVNNAFIDFPVEMNQVHPCSSASTSFINHGQEAMQSLFAPSLPAPLPSTSEHNSAFGSDHPLIPRDDSFGFLESLFLMGDGDASACMNHGREAMRHSLASSAPSSFATSPATAATLEYNRAFGSHLPSLPPESSSGFPESQFLMEGGDASAYFNHGQEAMDSLALSAPSSFVPSPSIFATSEHNTTFGGDLPSLPPESSSGFHESQFLMEGFDASAYLNHGQEAMDSLALSAPSSFVPSPSIAATLELNTAFGGDLPSLPPKSSSGFLESQFSDGWW